MYDRPLVKLLGRAARIRQYWLRQADDQFADRIISDPDWKDLERLLDANNLLTKEKRDASGRGAIFYHIRYAADILAEARDNNDVVSFYKDIEAELSGNVASS